MPLAAYQLISQCSNLFKKQTTQVLQNNAVFMRTVSNISRNSLESGGANNGNHISALTSNSSYIKRQ